MAPTWDALEAKGFEIGLKPGDFWNLTFRQFYNCLEGSLNQNVSNMFWYRMGMHATKDELRRVMKEIPLPNAKSNNMTQEEIDKQIYNKMSKFNTGEKVIVDI